jgi:superfamily I DNA/RNA helicase
MTSSSNQSIDDNSRSLFVTGDDGQSIYGFRGSSIDLILNFNKFYPKSKEIILNQNYRSKKAILDIAEKVLSHNPKQKKKNLFTENPSNELCVYYYLARNHSDEAKYIVQDLYDNLIKKITTKHDINPPKQDKQVIYVSDEDEYQNSVTGKQKTIDPVSSMFDSMFDNYIDASNLPKSTSYSNSNIWQDVNSYNHYNPTNWQIPIIDWSNCGELNNCAILYRTHAQSRAIEEVLLSFKVPYRLVSGTRFLDRKEVKDIISILKFVSNGSDKLALNRFLPLIIDGVGPKTMDKIIAFLDDPEYPLPPKFQMLINEVLTKITTIWQSNGNLISLTKELVIELGYLRYLKKEYPDKEDFLVRCENIEEIYSLMLPMEDNKDLSLFDKLAQFLEQISLMSNIDNHESEDIPKINLMTLHQSKGLEFDIVYLIGIEDGLLPHQNSLYELDGIEEEVRLAYVGVTRAKKRLHLLAAESRVLFGQIKAMPISRIFRPFLDKYSRRILI